MIRNLKVLLAAAMALTALGALSASAAQAHEVAKFHCNVAEGKSCWGTLSTDGTGATAHHVFVVSNPAGESVSFTCESLTGHATAARTATEIEFTNLVYSNCKANGQPAVVRMNGCKYNFITSASGATSSVTITGCNAGKSIEAEITGTGGIVTVGAQGPLNGISFKNEGSGSTTDITASANVPGITATADGNILINTAAGISSKYTTGNTTVKGFEDLGTNADGSPKEGAQVGIWWTATVA